MTTIRASLEPKLRASCEARLQKLRQISAPKQLIESLEAKLVAGNFAGSVSKISEFGDLEFVSVEGKDYRRGRGAEFTLSDGSRVWLIPGPYGLFLTDKEK